MKHEKYLIEKTVEVSTIDGEEVIRTWSLSMFLDFIKDFIGYGFRMENVKNFLVVYSGKFIKALMDQKSIYNGNGAIASNSKEISVEKFINKYF
jgi:zona occludens toxin (predicted ATPase)